jgi:hypothetical protein
LTRNTGSGCSRFAGDSPGYNADRGPMNVFAG